MNEHSLSGMCAYIKDFVEWYIEAKSPPDVMIFVSDRFSACTEDKKENLFKIFNKLSTNISEDGKLSLDTYDVASDLLNAL